MRLASCAEHFVRLRARGVPFGGRSEQAEANRELVFASRWVAGPRFVEKSAARVSPVGTCDRAGTG